MGCAFSCFRVVDDDDDDDERENPERPAFGYCICLRCFTLTQEFYTVLFQRGEVPASSSVQGATSQPGSGAEDSSMPESYHAPPRPLPYDDPRFFRLSPQHEGFVSRGDKASSHFHEESEPLRRRTIDTEYAGTVHKLNGPDCEGRPKLFLYQSSLKFPSKEATSGVTYIFSSSEDECPTCLEVYTSENPRITMQCSHHYHLSCIYEWMERSEACPVCGKVMVFNETN